MSKNSKKGEFSNPYGPLPIGDDLKNARKITRLDFERIANKYLHMNFYEIQEFMDPKAGRNIPVIDYMVLSVMYHAIKEGDQKRLDFLLDRTIGQAVRRLHVTTELEEVPKHVPVEMGEDEKLEMIERYKEKLLEVKARKESIDADNLNREDKP